MIFLNLFNVKFLWVFLYSIVFKSSMDDFLFRCSKMFHLKFSAVDDTNIKKPMLIISNHRSFIDSILIILHLYSLDDMVWGNYGISKRTFLTELFWKAASRSPKNINILYVGEQNIVEGFSEVLKQPKVGLLFPEGTRNKTAEKLLPFKSGADRIIKGAGCHVLMYYLENSLDVFRYGKTEHEIKYCFVENRDINGSVESIYREKFQI